MNAAHLDSEAIELYVTGAHDQISVADVEAHLRVCQGCTEQLRRQAQVELALTELAADARFCPSCSAVLTAARCPQCGAVAEVGGYRVERVLVQNAHGRMYLARDRAGQAVALKELAFVQPPHPDALDAFEREARLLRQLSHPQIPRFLAAFRDGEGVNTRLYLAQEYVEGESLLARLGRHQFSEAEATEVCQQVLAILEYLQSLAPMVFHRDVKPANLIRRPDGRIALVDFGAARDLGPTVGATLVGTFGYMPLEQMGGIVDASTDLYGLGATLAHLLSRREPWSFLEDPAALDRLNVSRGFRELLGKLLARRPADRFRSAAEATAALRGRPRRRWLSPARPRPSLKAVAVFMSLLFLVVGVLGGGLAYLTVARRPRVATVERSSISDVVEADSHVPPWKRKRLAEFQVCADRQGQVTSVILSKSSGDPELDAKALVALKKMPRKPSVVEGQPVPTCVFVRFGHTGQ